MESARGSAPYNDMRLEPGCAKVKILLESGRRTDSGNATCFIRHTIYFISREVGRCSFQVLLRSLDRYCSSYSQGKVNICLFTMGEKVMLNKGFLYISLLWKSFL